MRNTKSFDTEIRKYLTSEKSEVNNFIDGKYKRSNYKTYHDFFDDFLFSYGIISFNSVPVELTNKYIPYLNCTENNIFGEKPRITELSLKPQTLNECQKIFAEYFISKFSKMELKSLIEWNSKNNSN